MNIKVGTRLKYKGSDYALEVTERCEQEGYFKCVNALGEEHVYSSGLLATDFILLDEETVLSTQHGGDHYKKLGEYQPWQVLKAWLTPEEFRGYMKGTAIAYLAREKDKGGDLDVDKAVHTLRALREMSK